MTEEDPKLEALLDHLNRTRGFDFHSYKRPSLTRRIQKRMHAVQVEDFLDYLDYLEVHPEEFTLLFNTTLINVTSFFRDEAAWDYLANEVIPKILESKPDGEPIRVWSAGCASGEEVYSLAMVFAEALGAGGFLQRVKIYATDVDEEALKQGRLASYPNKDIHSIPAELREKYFIPNGRSISFRPELRHSIIFGRHDLMQDAPISRLDLLVCRNTLMYFNAEAQDKTLARFHFALNPDGFLFLGKAEMLYARASLFSPVAMKHRIFKKTTRVGNRERRLLAQTGEAPNATLLTHTTRDHASAFESSPIAQIVVDAAGTLSLVNERARLLFGITPRDLGRPLRDMEVYYRPIELHPLIESALAEHRTVKLASVERLSMLSEVEYFDILVTPLKTGEAEAIGIGIVFEDVTARHRLQIELTRANQEVTTLSEELQSAQEELETTNEELQSTNEELETTNEELQSSNEELETTNEELQSTNEELETMNEELQSTNEELEALNGELRESSAEANNLNTFLDSILASLRSAVLVVDGQLNLLLWNKRCEELWGLRADEVVGSSLASLDIGLPVQKLPIASFLAGKSDAGELTLEATNRRGKAIHCRVAWTPYLDFAGVRQGAILLMEEV